MIGSAFPLPARAGVSAAFARGDATCLDQAGAPGADGDGAAASSLDDDDEVDHGDDAWAMPHERIGHRPPLRVVRLVIVARATAYCSFVAEPTTPPPRA
ncbi:MAG TPA: hypothetical protein VFP84_34115 [Kofleriaceae bacterium]|nr:hypothetical protein [Kofleriaceae bacterium]